MYKTCNVYSLKEISFHKLCRLHLPLYIYSKFGVLREREFKDKAERAQSKLRETLRKLSKAERELKES